MTASGTELSHEVLRQDFRRWLADHATELEDFRIERPGSIDEAWAHQRRFQHLLFEHGWSRWGWPEECGGLGGSAVLRGIIHEEISAAGYELPEGFAGLEVIAPMLVRYAPPLAAEQLPRAIAGDEIWCQGFSEPDSGSDLGSLRTKAIDEGDNFRLVGQKTWTSDGHMATRCAVMARTGAPESGYRGISVFWVDMDTPGITVRPIMCANGRAEVSEVFLDDVLVPRERLIGELDGGWAVIMYLLQFERGNFAWQRQAALHSRLADALRAMRSAPEPHAPDDARMAGEAYLAVMALRSKSRATLRELAAGRNLGPEISVDKVLLGLAEQSVFEAARRLLWPRLEIGDDDDARVWRRQWSFSRITTIYGGAAEVQRDLIAERLLGLPRGH